MNKLVQMALNEAYRLYTHRAALRRERARWSQVSSRDNTPQVFYGLEQIPSRTQPLSGGLVKCQDLQERHPNTPHAPNLLYLVSSALPLHAEVMVRFAKQAGAPVVWNQNGVAYPAWHGRGWKQTNAPMARLHSQADYVFYQSHFCQLGATTFLGHHQGASEILFNPVDTHQFSPASEPPSLERPILLIAGSHHFAYRIERAIDTLKGVLETRPSAILMIAGKCHWLHSEAACQTAARNYARRSGIDDRLFFSGSYTQNDAPDLFRRAHILIHTQYSDPCPRLVVEAMACGLPVVYSATGGTPELIGNEAGIGIPGPLDWNHEHPPAASDLAHAVIRILDHYPEFRARARQRALTHLSLNPWLDRHTAVFTRLITGQPTP